MIITDALGHEIKEGDTVIYNLSGELALGIIKRAVITETRKVSWYPYFIHKYLIEILYTNGSRDAPKNHISKVRNPKGIVVIKDIPING